MNGSQQSFSDFTGTLYSSGIDITEETMGVGWNPSQGSLLVVKPAYNFNLPSYLTSGSIGQIGLQITLTCQDLTGYAFSSSDMVVIAVNSSLMVTQQGSSVLYTGLLTKEMVLATNQQTPAIDSSTLDSLVGGSIQEACHTELNKVLRKHFGKDKSGAGMSAGGMSAGEMSAGGMSAGRMGNNRMSKYM